MKKLIPVFAVILTTLGACSHQDAVRPDAPGDIIFNMSGGGAKPADNAAANPELALLQQKLANAEASLADKQREFDELAAQLQAALAGNPKNEDIDAIKHGLAAAQNEAAEAQMELDRLKAELAQIQAQRDQLLADKPAPADQAQFTFVQELDAGYNQLKAEIDRRKAALQALDDQKEAICAAGPAFDQNKCAAATARVDQEKQALLAFTQQNLNGFIDACAVKIAELDQNIAALPVGSPERVALEQEKAAVAALKAGYEAELANLQ